MSKEKQILQLLQDGYSQRRIADALCVSRNTVAKVCKASTDHPVAVQVSHRICIPSIVSYTKTTWTKTS